MQQPLLSRQRHRARIDFAAKRIIVFFGWVVLFTLGLLIWHLLSQALPIFKSPSISLQASVALPERESLVYMGDLERGGMLITRGENCSAHFYVMSVNRSFQRVKSQPASCESQVQVIEYNGEVYLAQLSANNLLRVHSIVSAGTSLLLDNVMSTALVGSDATLTLNAVELSPANLVISYSDESQQYTQWVERANPAAVQIDRFPLDAWVTRLASVKANVVVKDQMPVLLSTNASEFDRYSSAPVSGTLVATTDPHAIYFSQTPGQLTKWSMLNRNGEFELSQVFAFSLNADEHAKKILIDPSVNLGLILTNEARIVLFNRVSGEVLYRYQLAQQPTDVNWHGDYLYLASNEQVATWQVLDRDSTTTLSTLIEPQRYSGYQDEDYVWQTTNATDYQLAKYNVVPLIIGSLKASLVALVIAIPLALGAAVYTAYFAHASIRSRLKPTIEMLEAIPSVVVGFIAAVWLAPLAEQFLFSLVIFILITPLVLLLGALFQARIAKRLSLEKRQMWELPAVSLLIIALAGFAVFIGVDAAVTIANDFDVFFVQLFFETQSSKTTLVVAIALGIAISPTIFSLAEDAIEGVPDSLKKASFALGATRLQTLRNVVLRVALPGIIAAMMLGFGRAFGETMIVLMVTGNTPVADWSLLSGLRAMTANLAIELPEAEVGNTHYRILFLTACLLFVFTFIVNSFAELLRMRARKVSRT